MKLPVFFPALAGLGLLVPAGSAPIREDVDILITGGTVITMDSTRRVLDDGAVAIRGDRIVAVGTSRELAARFTGARGDRRPAKDRHARPDRRARARRPRTGEVARHGHGPVVSGHREDLRHGSTVDFWRAEALLTGVERVRFGVTTALSFFGGGDMIMRTDDQRYGDAYLQATKDVGLRYFLAVGPRRGPFPQTYTEWSGDSARPVPVTFEKQLEVSEALIRKWHGSGDGRTRPRDRMFPTHHPVAEHAQPGGARGNEDAGSRHARALAQVRTCSSRRTATPPAR